MKIFRSGAYESFYDMPIEINWDLTSRCNYRCSYCFDYGKGKVPPPQLPFSTLTQLKVAVDNIASLNRPWYDVKLGGGEPTIHPHLIDLIYLLHEKLGKHLNLTTIITNGSRNVAFYEKISDIAKRINIQLRISIHTDHVDMAHILELIENLSSYTDLRFTLMFNPAKREEVHLIYDIMCEYRKNFKFTMNIVTLRNGDRVDPRYTTADNVWQREALQQFNALEQAIDSKFPARKKLRHLTRIFHEIASDNEIKLVESKNRTIDLANGFLKFTGMYCIAHVAVLRIEENGLCRGMVCDADPYICNIYEKGSLKVARKYLIHAVQCSKNICGCISNDCIPKFASRLEAARFIEVVDAKQQALFDAAQ